MAHPDPNYSADRRIRGTTTLSVLLLAAIAAVVSFRHMHELALRHGESLLTAALIPLSVDGMIISASMVLLLESRYGSRGGVLPWTLLVVSSLASLAANVAVAEPTLIGRLIAAWPSFALVGAYEMLMRQIRQAAARDVFHEAVEEADQTEHHAHPRIAATYKSVLRQRCHVGGRRGDRALQRAAWQWALVNCGSDGSLPSGAEISRVFERSPRWGRLVKRDGLRGSLEVAG